MQHLLFTNGTTNCYPELAWKLSNELNHYESGHPSRYDQTEMDVRFD